MLVILERNKECSRFLNTIGNPFTHRPDNRAKIVVSHGEKAPKTHSAGMEKLHKVSLLSLKLY